MSADAVWLVAGLVVGALELLAPGYFLLWLGLAACGTGAAAALFRLGVHAQFAVFAVLAVALVVLAALRRRPVPDTVNSPEIGLVGATCYALGFQAGEGRVRLRDGTWQARTENGASPAPDETLRVVGLDGTVLLVRRAGVEGGV